MWLIRQPLSLSIWICLTTSTNLGYVKYLERSSVYTLKRCHWLSNSKFSFKLLRFSWSTASFSTKEKEEILKCVTPLLLLDTFERHSLNISSSCPPYLWTGWTKPPRTTKTISRCLNCQSFGEAIEMKTCEPILAIAWMINQEVIEKYSLV